MPELPEVDTIVEDLKRSDLKGSRILKVEVQWPRSVGCPSVEEFCHLLIDQRILDLKRRGKYIVLILSQDFFLYIHLRMTGRLLLVNQNTPKSSYIRLSLSLDNQKALYFHDTRKFGKWYLTQNPDEIVGKLGLEPFDPAFTIEHFRQSLHKSSRALKALLLDQTFLAGLGNIYVDEALWEAQLHPLSIANELSTIQAKKLHKSIITVLEKGIKNQGTTLGQGKTNYYRLDGSKGKHQTNLKVFRRTGQPCPRCGHLIERIKVAQRSTHFCPVCQTISKRVVV